MLSVITGAVPGMKTNVDVPGVALGTSPFVGEGEVGGFASQNFHL